MCSSAAVGGPVFSENMSCTVGDTVVRSRPALFRERGSIDMHSSAAVEALYLAETCPAQFVTLY